MRVMWSEFGNRSTPVVAKLKQLQESGHHRHGRARDAHTKYRVLWQARYFFSYRRVKYSVGEKKAGRDNTTSHDISCLHTEEIKIYIVLWQRDIFKAQFLRNEKGVHLEEGVIGKISSRAVRKRVVRGRHPCCCGETGP